MTTPGALTQLLLAQTAPAPAPGAAAAAGAGAAWPRSSCMNAPGVTM